VTTEIKNPHLELRQDLAGLEGRFGLRISAALNERSSQFKADNGERLRFAREQALEKAREARIQSKTVAAGHSALTGRGMLAFGAGGQWLERLCAVTPAVLLCFGLYFVDQWHDRARAVATVEVDAALLSDTLPPEAYDDPGFSEFLRVTEND
jgi:hypothetical protein